MYKLPIIKLIFSSDFKQQVLANVKDAARNVGIPAEVVGDLWELLVEASIAYELEKWDANRA